MVKATGTTQVYFLEDGNTNNTGTVFYSLFTDVSPAKPTATAFDTATGTFSDLSSTWSYVKPSWQPTDTSVLYWYSQFSVVTSPDGQQTILFQAPISAVDGTSVSINTATSSLKSEIEDPQGDSVGAEVFQQSVTLSDIETNASSSYVLRATAGGAESELELVAFSDADGGTASTLRMSADSILLDGTVTAEKLNVTELSAISANLGSIVVDNAHIGELSVGTSNLQDNSVNFIANTFVPDSGPLVTHNTASEVTTPLIRHTLLLVDFSEADMRLDLGAGVLPAFNSSHQDDQRVQIIISCEISRILQDDSEVLLDSLLFYTHDIIYGTNDNKTRVKHCFRANTEANLSITRSPGNHVQPDDKALVVDFNLITASNNTAQFQVDPTYTSVEWRFVKK